MKLFRTGRNVVNILVHVRTSLLRTYYEVQMYKLWQKPVWYLHGIVAKIESKNIKYVLRLTCDLG